MKATVITIANHKGGVGKTTTAVTLATGLAGLGHPTVLIDCDGQGSVAHFLALEARPALYELIVQERPATAIVQPVKGYPLLRVVTGNQDTFEVEDALNRGRRLSPATAFQVALQPFHTNGKAKPTVIVLDTAPSLSSIQTSALNASDWLLIPASPEFASEMGVAALVRAVAELQELGSGLNLLGILPTMVDLRSKEHRQTINDLEAAFPGMVLHRVRRLIALAEAPRKGRAIWNYDLPGGEDYGVVLNQVIERAGL